MFTQLFEDPTLVLAAGVLLEALLAVVFFQTGRGAVLMGMAGLLALTLAGVALEWLVVTPREEVEYTLDALARALEANDAAEVLSYLAPEAGSIRGRAESALGDFTIREAHIRGLKITLGQPGRTPRAQADFVGSIALVDHRGQSPYEHFIRRFRVQLEKRAGRWLLTSAEDRELNAGQ